MVHAYTPHQRLARLEALRKETTRELATTNTPARRARLEQLAARLDEEIATLRRRLIPAQRRHTTPQRTLPAPAIEIKRWAIANGYLTHLARGRIAYQIADAYAAAHPTASTHEDQEQPA